MFVPDKIYIDKEIERHARTRAMLGRVGRVTTEVVDDVRELKRMTDINRAKREMIITSHRGRAFKPCQGMPCIAGACLPDRQGSLAVKPITARDSSAHSPSKSSVSVGRNDGFEHICCCYYVIDLVSGCPMDCSYCILQYYLENNPRTTVYVNTDEILAEVDHVLRENRARRFRIGTGELADSLALDHITGHASELIAFFAHHENALIELKTKTDFVDHLLDCDHRGRTVISWSVNAAPIIASEERFTASLAKRLSAAGRCAAAGYRVGFHFDPIIISDGSAQELAGYLRVVEDLFDAVDPSSIAWVSLGLLRLPFAMKATVQRRFPGTRLFAGELVPAGNKMRYPRFLRETYYRPLWDALASNLPAERIYLCMETPAVWRHFDKNVTNHASVEQRLLDGE